MKGPDGQEVAPDLDDDVELADGRRGILVGFREGDEIRVLSPDHQTVIRALGRDIVRVWKFGMFNQAHPPNRGA